MTDELLRSLAQRLIGLDAPTNRATPFRARTVFTLTALPVRARLLSTALGVHQVFLNADAVDDGLLKPGWTAYQHRVVATDTDITDRVRLGANAVVIDVAGGWYCEDYTPLGPISPSHGDQPRAAAVVDFEFADGSHRIIGTDPSWRVSDQGPIRSSGIYQGETYDAARDDPAQHDPDYDDDAWPHARKHPSSTPCVRSTAPPVRVIETRAPVHTQVRADGRIILDFGQNLVGRLRLRVPAGAAGTAIVLRHAEVLQEGELATAPLRSAAATDRYLPAVSTRGEHNWAPSFTFHGFRFAEISGWPGVPDSGDIVAEVIGSDLDRTGWFASSSALLDRFHENVVWSARGNFLSIPTDCPQRDERLGWTGDIQAFVPAAATLFDVRTFLGEWLTDLRLEQAQRDGVVPFIIPNPLIGSDTPAAGWGDAATVVPWTLFERYGDPRVLVDALPSMRAWVQVQRSRMPAGIWRGDFQWGDWLDPSAPPENPAHPVTRHDLVATAFAYRSADLLARAEGIVGDPEGQARARDWGQSVQRSFHSEFGGADGVLASDTAAAYALALGVGLTADEATAAVWAQHLARSVRASGHRIATGFLATPMICDALADHGYPDDALALLLQTDTPSWLAPVLKGATTVWERWDSLLDDGSVNPAGMTSFNHYAFGAVADFLHRRVAGLAPAEPGYRRIRFAPLRPTILTRASSSLQTVAGCISIAWEVANSSMIVQMRVPAGCTAEFVNPISEKATSLGPGEHQIAVNVSKT